MKRREQIEEWYRRNPAKLLAKWKIHSGKRRAQKFGAVYERFPVSEIFHRDGWVCGICEDPVDCGLKYPDPMSSSLDHIVPLSLNGTHTRLNVRLAHLSCNVLRGNTLDEDS